MIADREASVGYIFLSWSKDDIANLATILELPQGSTISDIEKTVKWYFYSKTRAQGKAALKRGWAKLTGSNINVELEDQYEMPSYQQLLSGLLAKLKIESGDVRQIDQERFLCDAIIAEALVKMSPEQRRRAFAEQVDLNEITENLDSSNNAAVNASKGIGAFSLFNAAGFSLYTSSTMALSFASGMVGITLPFAVYTGMTSFISVIIGPVGWAACGSMIAWQLTSADWDRLRVAILYIITVRNRNSTDASPIVKNNR